MELTLVRHGETTWNLEKKVQGQADSPLTSRGEQQAQALAKELQKEISSFDMIYCSHLQRAKKTAEILKGRSKVPLIADSRLNSRNLGEFSGMTLPEIEMRYPILYDKWIHGFFQFKPPGGVSTDAMIEDIKEFIQFLKDTHDPNAKILIVSHRENIGCFRLLIENTPLTKETLRLPNCTPYQIIL